MTSAQIETPLPTQASSPQAERILRAVKDHDLQIIWRPDFAGSCAVLNATEWWFVKHLLRFRFGSAACLSELQAARDEELKRSQVSPAGIDGSTEEATQ